MRQGFCVDALPVDICTVSEVGSMVTISVEMASRLSVYSRVYPVTIVGAVCPVRSGIRCGMFTVLVAYENIVSCGESIQPGWL
jgi:hypothetical protein